VTSDSAGMDMPVTNVSEFWMPQKRLRGGFEPTDLWVMSPGGQSNLLLIRRLLHPSTLDFDPIWGRSKAEWQAYSRSGNRPDGIPAGPSTTYATEWTGWRDWLGNARNFLPFTEAREFARSLGLKSKAEWQAYSRSGNRPDGIPTTPYKE